jgi:D-aspartate ligase
MVTPAIESVGISPRSAVRAQATGAVVVGGDYQGLGIVRSLGRHGVPVLVVDDELSIARFSRYSIKSLHLDELREERSIVEQLLRVGHEWKLHGWVLYPTRDEVVAAFSRYAGELGQIFRVPTPDWTSIEYCWDKRKTYQLARALQIPTPLTVCPGEADGIAEIGFDPPYVIKPAIKEHFIYATKAKAWGAESRCELSRLYTRACSVTDPAELMVQEFIPGSGTEQFSYCAFFARGRAIGKMVCRRRRQHPLRFGRASTFVETVNEPAVEELSERFLRAIDYYGLVEIEYKFDLRDSKFKLLDVNARTWGYHTLGNRAGVDFTYMLYADQLGLPVSDCRAKTGCAWVRLTTDIPTSLLNWIAGDLSLSTYVRSLKACKVDGVFTSDDLKPGLAEIVLIPYLALKRGF